MSWIHSDDPKGDWDERGDHGDDPPEAVVTVTFRVKAWNEDLVDAAVEKVGNLIEGAGYTPTHDSWEWR